MSANGEEERKRTRLLEEYLRDVASKPEHERPATAEVITEAMKKVGYVGD
jgi:hypothetical protein